MNLEKLRTKTTIYFAAEIVLVILFGYLFIEIAEDLMEEDLKPFDFTVIEMIQSNISDKLTVIMKGITFFGGQEWLITATAIGGIILFFTYRRYGIYLVLTVAGGGMFNLLLKHLFERERPSFYRIIEAQGYSFPSGHSMSSFIFFTACAVILVKISKNTLADVLISLFFCLLVLSIGISRIYLGVHYPSDVIAGFAGGGFWIVFCTILLQIYEIRHPQK